MGTDHGIDFLGTIADRVAVEGSFVSAAPYGSGHINDTYAAVYRQGTGQRRYIHQRINARIFRDVPGLMGNVSRVCRHCRASLERAGGNDIDRRTLTLVPARDGASFVCDAQGGFWRTYLFIEGARTYDVIETANQAREAARAFGAFQSMLADLPARELVETIPDFHNTPVRFARLQAMIEADPCNRAATVADEIAFFRQREAITGRLTALEHQGILPVRVTHNDTKLNNVMLDDRTGEGICVIDLDTVMPGLVLYDFGDMVRTATSPAAEDERDVSRVTMRMVIFEALVEGYLGSAGAFLTRAEVDELVFAGRLVTLEIGIRFLTDYLEGDVYFKTYRPGHNLDRARTQIRLVACIEAAYDRMQAVVERRR